MDLDVSDDMFSWPQSNSSICKAEGNGRVFASPWSKELYCGDVVTPTHVPSGKERVNQCLTLDKSSGLTILMQLGAALSATLRRDECKWERDFVEYFSQDVRVLR